MICAADARREWSAVSAFCKRTAVSFMSASSMPERGVLASVESLDTEDHIFITENKRDCG
jgi:hypothetical protein